LFVMSLSHLSSIYCCLLVFSDTTRHESNHHPSPSINHQSTQYPHYLFQHYRYTSLYEPLGTGKCRETEKRYSYIKCNLVDRTFTIHNVRGYVFCYICYWLLSFLVVCDDVSVSLLSIYCCLPEFSDTTGHESNHHHPPLINRHYTHITYHNTTGTWNRRLSIWS
jgi:hypothetical protein